MATVVRRRALGCAAVLALFLHTKSVGATRADHSTLNTSLRVDVQTLAGCSNGGANAAPISVSTSTKCPCFLEYQFFPDKASVWDVYFLEEAVYTSWRSAQFAAKPASYQSEYSVVGKESDGGGGGLALSQTNVLLNGAYRLVFRARALQPVCFLERKSDTDESLRTKNYAVFEAMPPACPVVVPDPPVRPQQRVVGGTPVAANGGLATFFPWIAVIWLGTRRSICGGSQIAPGFILTAAHCQLQSDIGAYNVRIGNENYDEGARFSIKRIWVHEGFELLDGGGAINDLAILELSNRDSSKDLDVVEINTNPNIPRAGQYVTTAGYGHLSEGWSKPLNPHPLRKVDIPMWSTGNCSAKFPAVNDKMHICAGERAGGCDSCQADSGGPLRYVATDANGTRQALLVGVVSFGSGCALRDLPGVYAKVASYAPWIQGILGGDRDADPTSVASNKPAIISSTWGIALITGLAGLAALLAVVLIVIAVRRRGRSGEGEMEAGGEASDVPSTSGIST